MTLSNEEQNPDPCAGLRCVVLGATSGIGLATARALALSGADVIVHGRDASRAALAARDVRERQEIAQRRYPTSEPRREAILLADLADPVAGMQLVERAWDTWGGIDAWVHFAGADTLTGAAAKLPFEDKLALLWSVDVLAAVRLCRAVGSRMKDQGHGVILTMGWDQAETGMEGDAGALFGTTKGAVHAFTRALAVDLAPSVRVNAVAPGWIQTAWGRSASDAWQQRAVREAPLARWGTPEDVARTARFLISRDAAFLTGQILRVNGGATRG